MKKSILLFIFGSIVGSASTWKYIKKKYERLVQDEIESVKKTLLNKEKEIDKTLIQDDQIQKEEIRDYNEILEAVNYSNYSNNRNEEVKPVDDGPYTISPDEFGENEDYQSVSLVYYADEFLADDDDDVVDDIDGTVGYDSLTKFGEYEDDSVFVRNDELKIDYEICIDKRKYTAVIGSKTYKQDCE